MEIFGKIKHLVHKISLPYLIFMTLCLLGCLFQVIQISKVYFKYATKINIKIDTSSQIVVPLVSFCKTTNTSYKTTKRGRLTPAKIYKNTYDISEVFFYCEVLNNNSNRIPVGNCANVNKLGVQYEKTVNDKFVCYHFKHPQFAKNLSRVQDIVYKFMFYHFNEAEFWLYLTSEKLVANGFSWKALMLSGI